YTRDYVVFDSEPFASIPAWVLVPKSATAAHPAPGVLCCHGHDVLGKHAVVGVDHHGNPVSTGAYHDLAVRLAERGYVAIPPDWRGFGERSDTDEWVRRPSRDGCNVYYLGAGYFGYHALALQIHDGQRTLDYLLSRPEVRCDRIGCVGVSFGGTMTTYLSALDERIGCAVIVCYLNTLQDILERANTCGAQYMPGLATLGDVSDVAGLIAPRAMMAEIGEHDACFTVDDAMRCYNRALASDADWPKWEEIEELPDSPSIHRLAPTPSQGRARILTKLGQDHYIDKLLSAPMEPGPEAAARVTELLKTCHGGRRWHSPRSATW
ncbi:MAG: dienelactone hydrolase family protein, partial [Armatimonadetes bacterium]|nr:dienelactone hydrolase family protein [Armatimonadota bacterium]